MLAKASNADDTFILAVIISSDSNRQCEDSRLGYAAFLLAENNATVWKELPLNKKTDDKNERK